MVAFFGTRTYDIGTLSIRIAGFQIRDQLAWVFATGFPKSMNISKAIDANLLTGEGESIISDEAKEWEGWGTALKPAYEPIVLARKPLIGTVAKNVLEYGTGGD